MKRSKSHRIDARAKKIFNYNSPDHWSVQKPDEDYGLDYFVQVFEDDDIGEATEILFYIQLKGTTNYNQNDTHVKFSSEIEYLKYFIKLPVPVFLVVVDVNTEDYCWLFLQKYINEELKDTKKWNTQKSTTLYIPKENTFSNPEIIEKCAREGIRYCNMLVHGIADYHIRYQVEKITNDPIKKAKLLDDDFSRELKERINVTFDLLNKDNISESENNILKVYKRTVDDEKNIFEHLKSIIVLTRLQIQHTSGEQEQLSKYLEEGLDLSEKYDITPLISYFKGRKLEKNYYDLQNKLSSLLNANKVIDTTFQTDNEFYINQQNEIFMIRVSIHEIFDEITQLIRKSVNDENLFSSIELIELLIEIQLHYIQTIQNYEEQSNLNNLFNQVKDLITSYEKFAEITDNFYDKCNLFQFKSVYYSLKNDEKCLDIIEELIKYANENNSEFIENKSKTLKEHMEYKFNNQKTNLSTKEIMEEYEQLLSFVKNQFGEEHEYAIPIIKGIHDLNPQRVLKNCINLELEYKHAGLYEEIYGLYSAGTKVLYCRHGEMKYGSDLDDVYMEFSEEFCNNCEYKQERDLQWEYRDSYVESDEFRELLKFI